MYYLREVTMFLRILIAFAGLILLSACSGGNRYLDTQGKICANNYAPLSLTITGQKVRKISIDPADGDLPAGDYAYNGADVYYYNPQLNQRVFFQDAWSDQKKAFVVKNGCVGGLEPGQEFSASITGVKSIEVQSSTKSIYKVRNYEVTLDSKTNQLSRTAKDGEAAQPDSNPSKVFDNEISDYNFYQVDANNYELRVRAVSATTGQELWLAVRYVRKALPGSQQLNDWLKNHPIKE